MTTPSPAIDFERLRDRFLDAQLRGDRREAMRVLMDEGLCVGADVLDLQLHVIQSAQRELGRLWQENRVSIAQEHLATAISNVALTHLYQHAQPRRSNGRTIIVACVESELHDLPARIVADALELAGFTVRFLGASVPTDSLVQMVNDTRPDAVALSATMAFNVPALRTAVARLRAECPPSVRLAVGGGACAWIAGIADELQADITGRDAAELVANSQRVLGVEP